MDSGVGVVGMVGGGGVVGGGCGFADSCDARDVGGGVPLWGGDWGIGECDGIIFGGDGGVWVVSGNGSWGGGLVDWGERVGGTGADISAERAVVGGGIAMFAVVAGGDQLFGGIDADAVGGFCLVDGVWVVADGIYFCGDWGVWG